MGLSNFFRSVGRGLSNFGGVVKSVSNFGAQAASKIGAFAEPVANALGTVLDITGLPGGMYARDAGRVVKTIANASVPLLHKAAMGGSLLGAIK